MAKITKMTAEVKFLLPTVQYGNVTINNVATVEAEAGEDGLDREDIENVNKVSLDAVLQQKAELDKLTRSDFTIEGF